MDVKWIKITTNLFDDEKIKIIDTMPARDEILVIWFKLLALGGKVNQNGMLFMSNRIPYTPEMLSAVFNRELNTVKLALSTFEKFGMIEVEDNQVISIANWEKHQNIDGLDKIREQARIRQEKHRSKQKLLASGNVTDNVTVTEDNALELELELDREKEKKKNSRFTPPTFEEVDDYCKERNNSVDAQKFIDFYESKGWMIGKNKMKSWAAAVRTWEYKENQTTNKPKEVLDFSLGRDK